MAAHAGDPAADADAAVGPDPDTDSGGAQAPDRVLERLAALHGVATSYDDHAGRPVTVDAAAVRAVLTALGVDLSDLDAAVALAEAAPWQDLLPPCVVVTADRPEPVLAHPLADTPLWCWVEFEGSGATVEVTAHGPARATRTVEGQRRTELPLHLPEHLPLGWHTLHLACGGQTAAVPLVVAPRKVPLPFSGQQWGWMVQLYALRSQASWGLGDYTDLAQFSRWAAHGGAGLVLVNPLHAPTPGLPQQDSPYSPSSRRVPSPLYLRLADLPAYEAAPPEVREAVDQLAPPAGELIDRDATFAALREGLSLLWPYAGHLPPAEDELADARQDVALFTALAEEHGPDWRTWPEPLRDPQSSAVESARVRLDDRVGFFAWVYRCCEEQLAAAQRAARVAGMAVGVVHDLAVGVDPGGADAWLLQRCLAPDGWHVGAPPDSFNQQGQDWGLPPWHPRRLAEAGYAPWRDVVRATLALGGGLRIDHVLGLFRLWWVPPGRSAAEGTYVSYDADALLGVLALEATRAGALVVAEDLGTVPAEAEHTLTDRGLLGSVVAWFAREGDGFCPPQQWREMAMASLSTHDLPTAAGWLTGEHVAVRGRLGLLGRPEAEEAAAAAAEREALLDLLVGEGLLDPELRRPPDGDATDAQDEWLRGVVLALHRMLAASRSRVLLASLGDALGDRSQPNLPGTLMPVYPSWRLPVRDASGAVLSRQQVQHDPRIAEVARVMDGARSGNLGS